MTKVQRLRWNDDLAELYRLRLDVFVTEQHVPQEQEIDERDTMPGTYHVLVCDPHTRQAMATGRVFRDASGIVHIGRVAVRRGTRGTGLGSVVMSELATIALEEFASEGKVTIELSAQLRAIGFYEKLGYRIINNEVYLDAGIEHKDMAQTFHR
ncbi:GNAT family N-acetyltransferase [Arcanobacterium buesumense]|uniref:GNAT family N-acetyltransferase n=1 Tax=Arcanobacterium buesumense TaxID=2722751 RepID=A0A6H2EK76_9ACTO|nr:GNAT family N-acetyltransferase [Arcanobacterium buesumense]QJC21620.1 GNAT family N-acetyltransferase [Arcanobacterium buesumense]